jgi:hypothetical protein
MTGQGEATLLAAGVAYDTYAARSSRDLRVFILRPAAG